MQNCLDCATPVNARCVSSEKKFSVDKPNIDELILHLDQQIVALQKTLSTKLDPKTFEEKEFVYDYIQELINRVETLSTAVESPTSMFTINSTLLGNTPKTLLQVLTTLVKEVEALKGKEQILGSSMYLPNV